MYAVIKTGGKQYKVAQGGFVDVEKIEGKEGDKLTFENVLMVGGDGAVRIGHPAVEGATVDAEVASQYRAKKIIVYKKKRRKGYEKRRGHRQYLTRVKVLAINA